MSCGRRVAPSLPPALQRRSITLLFGHNWQPAGAVGRMEEACSQTLHFSNMRPAERIAAIKESATLLSLQEWGEIDLVLREHNLPTTRDWEPEDKYGYVVAMLNGEPPEKLRQLHEYLTGEASSGLSVGPQPWRPGHFKLFVSHLAAHQEFVGHVGVNLARYGVSCSWPTTL